MIIKDNVVQQCNIVVCAELKGIQNILRRCISGNRIIVNIDRMCMICISGNRNNVFIRGIIESIVINR